MAIPTETLRGHWGVALMKQYVNTGEWFFCSWVKKGSAIVDQVSPGTWVYQLWLVCGQQSGVSSVTVAGTSSMACLKAMR